MNQPLAYVHPGAKIAKNVVIEPFTTIHNNVVIGEGTWIGSNVTIMEGASNWKKLQYFPGLLFQPFRKTLNSRMKKHGRNWQQYNHQNMLPLIAEP